MKRAVTRRRQRDNTAEYRRGVMQASYFAVKNG